MEMLINFICGNDFILHMYIKSSHFTPQIYICICQQFSTFLSHGTHKLITEILWHTKKYIILFADVTKNKYNFLSFHIGWLLCWLLSFFYLTV